MRKLDLIDIIVILIFTGITVFLVMWYTEGGTVIFRYLHELVRQVWINSHRVNV
jgi:hypothetical protein